MSLPIRIKNDDCTGALEAEFIYKTIGPRLIQLGLIRTEENYLKYLKTKEGISTWKDQFEKKMSERSTNGESTFTYEELSILCIENQEQIQPRYEPIVMALYNSLKPHY